MHGRGPAGTRFHGEAAKLQLMANFDLRASRSMR
jgi:hypothetical protein